MTLLYAALTLAILFGHEAKAVGFSGMAAHRDCIVADATATADTIIDRRRSEVGDWTTHMVQSTYPVKIRTVGNAVCVKTKYIQTLPVYTEGGTFYAAFRLNKGKNWLSGLPRGTYYINNRKIVIH